MSSPERFSFFQLVQLVERQHGGAARVGHLGPVAAEVLRFRPYLSLAFPRADIESIDIVTAQTEEGDVQRVQVDTTFLGLYGTMSPLPNYYTEDLLQELGEESPVRAFLDIFHHRLISLFYRCWEKFRHYVQYRDGADPFSQRLHCLMGFSGPAATQGLSVEVNRLTRYAGILNARPSSVSSMCRMVTDYFGGVAAYVTPWIERQVEIPARLRCSLGLGNCKLNDEFYLGTEITDRSGRFRLHLGPLSLQQYQGFLPGQSNLTELVELISYFNSDRLLFDIELCLRQEEIPRARLEESVLPRLNHTSWLGLPAADGTCIVYSSDQQGASSEASESLPLTSEQER